MANKTKNKDSKSNKEKDDKPFFKPLGKMSIAKLFFYTAPLIGLLLGVVYLQNRDKKVDEAQINQIIEQYNLTDKEIINIVEYKIKAGNNIVKRWYDNKIEEEISKELQRNQKSKEHPNQENQ